MDGYTSTGAAGILYAEDFDEPPAMPPAPPAPAPAWNPAPPPPGLTQADVDAACIRAVCAAEQAWTQGAEERRTLALEAIGTGLLAARQDAAAEAETLADGLARTMLGMLAGALPDLCRTHGDAEVRALLRRLLPVVGRRGTVVVRLHAGLIDTAAADLAALDDDLVETVQWRAANLPPGDVRLSWPDGGMVRDAALLRAAMADCLSQLGLVDSAAPALAPAPAPAPEPRSAVHAH